MEAELAPSGKAARGRRLVVVFIVIVTAVFIVVVVGVLVVIIVGAVPGGVGGMRRLL